MRRVISVPLPVVLTLVLLPLLAFANPPDPSWIAGIYDGGDGDDVVTLVYETAGIEYEFFQLVPPHLRLSEMQCLSRLGIGHAFSVCTFTRGPPSTSDFNPLPPQLLSSRHHLTLHRATPVSPSSNDRLKIILDEFGPGNPEGPSRAPGYLTNITIGIARGVVALGCLNVVE